MADIKEIHQLAVEYGVTERGIEILTDVRNSEPARRVRASSRRGNKTIRYPSQKMGVVIQAESETLEFSGILEKEHSPNVLEYWDQPPSLSLVYKSGKRTVRSLHTIDFFVISQDFIGYEEWKHTTELDNIAKKRPDHIHFDRQLGRYVSPAMERALQDTGLNYRIFTERDVNPILVENLDFLDGYYSRAEQDADFDNQVESIQELLISNKHIFISELIATDIHADCIYQAIAYGLIHFPLKDLRLTDIKNASVFHTRAVWEAYLSANQHLNDHSTEFSFALLSDAIRMASPAEIEETAKKLKVVHQVRRGELTVAVAAKEMAVSERTIDRWRAAIKACNDPSNELDTLLPKNYKKGNRQDRLSVECKNIIDLKVEEDYLSDKAVGVVVK